MRKTKLISTYIDKALYFLVEVSAKKLGCSKSWWVGRAIREKLERERRERVS